jgi:hypothetical protein
MPGQPVSPPPVRSYAAAAKLLAERDPVLRRLVDQTGPPRLAARTETHFGTLVRAIVTSSSPAPRRPRSTAA